MTDRVWLAAGAILAAAALFWTNELGFVMESQAAIDARGRQVEVPWLDPPWRAMGTSVLYAAAIGGLALSAVRGAVARRRIAWAVAIAATVVPVAAGVLALPEQRRYTTDSIAYVHHAALRVLEGANPYGEPTYPAAQDRLGMHRAYHTTRTDGRPDTRYPYPAGSFLVAIPVVGWGGFVDLRWLSLAALIALAALLDRRIPRDEPPWPAVCLAAFALLARFTYGSVTDAQWALPAGAAWLLVARQPLAAGALLGLACSIKQSPWLVAPFFALAVWRAGGARAAVRAVAAAALVFAATNAWWAAQSPAEWVDGVLSPFLHPLSPGGHGLIAFEHAQLIGPLGRTGYAIATLGTYVALLAAYARFPRLAPLGPVLGLLPAFLSWRSHTNHYLMVPLLLFAGPPAALEPPAASEA